MWSGRSESIGKYVDLSLSASLLSVLLYRVILVAKRLHGRRGRIAAAMTSKSGSMTAVVSGKI